MSENPIFNKIKLVLLCGVIFLFPLFFLPTTPDFFATNKFYLLILTALLLIAVSSLEIIITKKFIWQNTIIDKILVIFVLAVGLSTLFASPNKIQALLNPTFSFPLIASLAIITFFLSRVNEKERNIILKTFFISSSVTAIISILFLFQPLKNISLPFALSIMKAPYFNTMGNLLDQTVFLGLGVVFAFSILFFNHEHTNTHKKLFYLGTFILTFVGFIISLYALVTQVVIHHVVLPLPPLRSSWAAAIDIFKNPITAFFGIGIDNFGAIFTRERDILFNLSSQWQVTSFNTSRSAFLHILTEGGLLTILSFVLLIVKVFPTPSLVASRTMRYKLALPLLYTIIVILFLPPTITSFFILFITIAFTLHSFKKNEAVGVIDLSNLMPIYLVIGTIGLIVSITAFYFLNFSYRAEMHMAQAITAEARGDLQKVYDNHMKAIRLNPYMEQYRISFAQVNMYIASGIFSNSQTQNKADKNTTKISDTDKKIITDRIQIAISESKAVVTLNPYKATNWENLASTYRNVLNVAQGADTLTISSYEQAIALDPNNPTDRLNLGGVYYSLGQYANAQRTFEQAANLKSNWSNAYYNYAWASYQNNDIQNAVGAMQYVLSLVNPKKDPADFKQAETTLENFKKKLADTQTQNNTENSKVPSKNLTLPTPLPSTNSAQIKLPASTTK